MKKFFPICICLVLLLSGCRANTDEYLSEINKFFKSETVNEVYESIVEKAGTVTDNIISYVKSGIAKDDNSITIDPSYVTFEYEDYIAYQTLTQNQKKLYSIFLSAINNMELRQIDITKYAVGDVFSEAVIAHRALMCDRPDMFWAPKTFSVLSAEKSNKRYICFSDNTENNSDTGYYGITKSQKQEMQAELDAVTENIVNNANLLETDFQKELYIHDYICENVTYDEESATSLSEADLNSLTVYGALVEGKAICEGYSKAMQYLCTKVGIPCGVVYGKHETVPHMWNIIRVDGDSYYLDVTFDDSSKIAVLHTYFNITKSEISNDHIFDSEFDNGSVYDSLDSFNFFCPDCEYTSMNFFENTGAYITYTCEKAREIIAEQNENGKNCAEFKNSTFLPSDAAFLLLKNACRGQVRLKTCYKMDGSDIIIVIW